MILSQIAAMSKNRVIGKDNTLPWKLPEDMKFFRAKTDGKIMIMGRKTFASLPGHLPNRFHIVVSRTPIDSDEEDVRFVSSINEAIKVAGELTEDWPEEIMIIGGGEIYKQTLPLVDKIYLTIIDQEIEGDAYFPDFGPQDFKLIDEQKKEKPFNFRFCVYQRK